MSYTYQPQIVPRHSVSLVLSATKLDTQLYFHISKLL